MVTATKTPYYPNNPSTTADVDEELVFTKLFFIVKGDESGMLISVSVLSIYFKCLTYLHAVYIATYTKMLHPEKRTGVNYYTPTSR